MTTKEQLIKKLNLEINILKGEIVKLKEKNSRLINVISTKRKETLAEVRNKIKKLRKKSDRCSDCDGCNCDLCMLEFVKLKQLEGKSLGEKE